MQVSSFASEWKTLQQQCDNYEKLSLTIKLVNVLLVAGCLLTNTSNYYLLILVLVLWLQDGIWKTFQARTEQRLLEVEQNIATQLTASASASASANESKLTQEQSLSQLPFQFNQSFINNRPSSSKLIAEYIKQALRPTVAFPHVVLTLVMLSFLLAT